MLRFDHWYLPDGERHLQSWMNSVGRRVDGRLTYQFHKYEAALQFVPVRNVAVDVGAHVGLWSYFMARDFASVVAFEPMKAHADCWVENMAGHGNATLHRVALGETVKMVALSTRRADSSGDTGVDLHGGNAISRQCRLDDFDLDRVDFIKVDCEGYELFVLRGAGETIRRCKPVIVVEQKPHTGGPARYGIGETAAVTFLQSLGMKEMTKPMSGDWIMGW